MSKPQPKKETRSLFRPLSEDETQEMTKNLTDNLMQIDSLTEEKKATAKQFKTQIDTLHDHNSNLAKWLNDKGRDLDTAVEVVYNWPKDGVKTITRMDTHEAWEETMTESENTLDNLPEPVYNQDDEF